MDDPDRRQGTVRSLSSPASQPPTPTAGDRLRADLDSAPTHASQELGRTLEFDEVERHVIDQAVAAADRAEEITVLYRAELARKPRSKHSANGGKKRFLATGGSEPTYSTRLVCRPADCECGRSSTEAV